MSEPLHELPTVRAETDPKFYTRFKWLGPLLVLFSLYCVYDGYYTWPDQRTRGVALAEIAKAELTDEEMHAMSPDGHGMHDLYPKLVDYVLDDETLAAKWQAQVEENGWPTEPPAKFRTEGDIYGQYLMAVLVAIAAAWMLGTVVMSWGRWIEFNESGIATSWRESFAPGQVTAIDKKKWRDKGIAYVRYSKPEGGSRRFVVDDYKYHKARTREILRRLELGAGLEKITGGKPEPDPTAQAETGQPEAAQPGPDQQAATASTESAAGA